MLKSTITAEERPKKVGATYKTEHDAKNAVQDLKNKPELGPANITIVTPGDTSMETKVEPEGSRIWHTALRAHTSMGLAGVALGLITSLVLMLVDVPAVTTNPFYAVVVLMLVGGLAGMMIGGLLTLRPDHDVIVKQAREAKKNGHWFVLLHINSDHQKNIAQTYFEQNGKNPVASL